MRHHIDRVLNTLLRSAATALMGALASLFSLAPVHAQNGPLVITIAVDEGAQRNTAIKSRGHHAWTSERDRKNG